MTRFFVEPSGISDGKVRMSPEDMAHIRVLRMRPNELFIACDGEGTDYICRLCGQADALEAEIVECTPSRGEPNIRCTVFMAFSKGDRLDTAVQKSSELGAYAIVIFPSERCVSIPDARSMPKKIERLQRIALEAAKQSGRGRIPPVTTANSFSSAAEAAAVSELPLFFYELESSRGLKAALESAGGFNTAAIFTGPEGGFSPEEAEYASSKGMRTVSLGPRILRCETAPLCALSAVMFHTGNM